MNSKTNLSLVSGNAGLESPISTEQNKPALRLVSTKSMSRDKWLNIRKQGIGASDAAAAMGISPYQSQLELWMVKTGRDANLEKPKPDDQESPMYWGNILEPIVAKHYTMRTGNKVRRVNAVLQHPDEDKRWMLANLDYAVSASDDVQILECKTAGEHGAKLWRDGVPDYVRCQVQHQLAVTGKQAADVCVLICGQKVEVYRVDRDDELIAQIIELERAFWHYVETDTPPPADGSDSASKALRALYPYDNEESVNFTDDKLMNTTLLELLHTREKVTEFTKHEELLKQAIQERMQNATKAVFADATILWRKSKDSTSLDTKALLNAQPELLEQYGKTRLGSRRFTIKH